VDRDFVDFQPSATLVAVAAMNNGDRAPDADAWAWEVRNLDAPAFCDARAAVPGVCLQNRP
jgi:hypothetical protein